ncbi:MAG: hypothetical protein WB999_00040 [Candidatus Binataceae bacterium]
MAEITRRLHPRQRRAIVSQLPVAIPNSFSRTGRLRRLAVIVLQRLPVVISFHFAPAEIIEDNGRLPDLALRVDASHILKTLLIAQRCLVNLRVKSH